MKRTDKFLISQKPYAVDLSSLRVTSEHTRTYDGSTFYSLRINAVWFRRRREGRYGELRTVACIGTLWDNQDEVPTGREFLERHDDGRYGGDCDGRWDGKSYWGNVTLEEQERHLAILRPMLDNHPAIPAGYAGWWRF